MTENASAPLLQVQGLNAWYGAAQILFDVSLQVGRGGAAGAVAAQQRDHLARLNVDVDTVQDVRFTVPGVQVLDADGGGGCVAHE